MDDRLEPFVPVGPGYFVELGANDGIVQSNTYWLEVERGWSGLLIEPALNRYIELRRNRSDANAYACAACVPFGYTDEFVRMQYANLMTVSRSLPTDLADVDAHIATSTQFLTDGEETVTFGACARTLQSLLDDAQAPRRIDFLSLDVEGAELAVLGGVDHDRTRFDLALIESRDVEALERVLAGHDYGLVAQLSHHDYLIEDRRLSGPRSSP